jgi:hypothetical protein
VLNLNLIEKNQNECKFHQIFEANLEKLQISVIYWTAGKISQTFLFSEKNQQVQMFYLKQMQSIWTKNGIQPANSESSKKSY